MSSICAPLGTEFRSAQWNSDGKLSQALLVGKLIAGTYGNRFSHENEVFEFKMLLHVTVRAPYLPTN